jgi:inner membrane family protein
MNLNNVFKKVYMWMFIGLLLTFATGYFVSINENMAYKVYNLYWVLAIIEIILVIVLSARIGKMNITTSRIMFLTYSFVSGLTFSSVFIAYDMRSIIIVFLISSLLFLIFAILGYITKLDLTSVGTFLLMALIGIVICSIINIFVGNGTFEIVICSISILIFLGFTAYDVNKIKQLQDIYPDEDSLAIVGALELYLDFINIFLDLLRIVANNRD